MSEVMHEDLRLIELWPEPLTMSLRVMWFHRADLDFSTVA